MHANLGITFYLTTEYTCNLASCEFQLTQISVAKVRKIGKSDYAPETVSHQLISRVTQVVFYHRFGELIALVCQFGQILDFTI